jgi:hypothetical protein
VSDTPLTPLESAAFRALKEETRELDALDVRSGKITPESLHFIPPGLARQCTVVFPERYAASKPEDDLNVVVPCHICGQRALEPDPDGGWARPLCETHKPLSTFEQQAHIDALAAACFRYLGEKLSKPAAGEPLSSIIHERAELDGQVIAGAQPETKGRLLDFVAEEMARRGIVHNGP